MQGMAARLPGWLDCWPAEARVHLASPAHYCPPAACHQLLLPANPPPLPSCLKTVIITRHCYPTHPPAAPCLVTSHVCTPDQPTACHWDLRIPSITIACPLAWYDITSICRCCRGIFVSVGPAYPAERWPFATPDAITPADITCFKSVNLLTFGPSEGTASTNNGDANLYKIAVFLSVKNFPWFWNFPWFCLPCLSTKGSEDVSLKVYLHIWNWQYKNWLIYFKKNILL